MLSISVWFFVFIITLGFFAESILETLNLKHKPKILPPEVSDIYSQKDYSRQQAYERVATRFSLFQGLVLTTIITLALLFGAFGWLHQYILQNNFGPVTASLVFFAVLFAISKAISLPFSIYSNFVIEKRFGFNKLTQKLFFIDQLKSVLLTIAIGGTMLLMVVWVFYRSGSWFWLLALALMIIFSFIANWLYPRIIMPLFHRMEPLGEGSLRDLMVKFSAKVGFPMGKILVIDGSRRTTKANAFFSGFGRNRRIVLFDTLLEKLSDGEVLAVIAHEIGHYRKHHLWVNMALSTLQAAAFLYLFNLLSYHVDAGGSLGFKGSESPIFHLSIIGLGILFSPIDMLLGIVANALSRKMERQADAFAKEHNLQMELIGGLKNLALGNLSNIAPHPAYVFVHYSHPPLVNRIKSLLEPGPGVLN